MSEFSLALAVLAALAWAVLLGSPATRTARTVVMLSGSTVSLISALSLPSVPRMIIGVPAILLPVIVLVGFPWLVSPLSRVDTQYDDQLGRIAERLHRLSEQHPYIGDPQVRANLASAYQAALAELEAATPPHPEWTQLRSLFLEHVRFNLEVYEGRRRADLTSRAQASADWETVRAEWRRVRMQRMSFWR